MKHGSPFLKHGVGYDRDDYSEEELDIWDQLWKEEEAEDKKNPL